MGTPSPTTSTMRAKLADSKETYLRLQWCPLRPKAETRDNLDGNILLNLGTRKQTPQYTTDIPPIQSIRQHENVNKSSDMLTRQPILLCVFSHRNHGVVQDLFVDPRFRCCRQFRTRQSHLLRSVRMHFQDGLLRACTGLCLLSGAGPGRTRQSSSRASVYRRVFGMRQLSQMSKLPVPGIKTRIRTYTITSNRPLSPAARAMISQVYCISLQIVSSPFHYPYSRLTRNAD
jgi:hypothetical protein